MIYSAEVFAESAVDSGHLEAATEAIVRLTDGMGITTVPDISLKTIPESMLPLNNRQQVDRTIIDGFPYDDTLRLIVTARDLGAGDDERSRLNFVYGTSRLGRVIMSTSRLQSNDDFAALTLHEAGHAEGLVQASQRNYNRLSGFGGHCVNQCVMRAGNSYQDMQSMVRKYRTNDPFCGDCSDFLLSRPRLAW